MCLPNRRTVNSDCQQIYLFEEKLCLSNRVDLRPSRSLEASDRWDFRYGFTSKTPQKTKNCAPQVSQRNWSSAARDLVTQDQGMSFSYRMCIQLCNLWESCVEVFRYEHQLKNCPFLCEVWLWKLFLRLIIFINLQVMSDSDIIKWKSVNSPHSSEVCLCEIDRNS